MIVTLSLEGRFFSSLITKEAGGNLSDANTPKKCFNCNPSRAMAFTYVLVRPGPPGAAAALAPVRRLPRVGGGGGWRLLLLAAALTAPLALICSGPIPCYIAHVGE